jgi:hypothetical protein
MPLDWFPDSPPERTISWREFSLDHDTGVCAPLLDLDRWLPWLQRLPGLLNSSPTAEIHHLKLLSTGRRTFQVTGADGRMVVVKCYPGTALTRLPMPEGGEGGNHAWDGFRCNWELWHREQPVPEPLIFLERRPGPDSSTCYSITRLLEGCHPLADFAFEHLRRRRSPKWLLNQWCETVVSSVIRLHRTGYAHGDLHHQNLLVSCEVSGRGFKVFFIDFDACKLETGIAPHAGHLLDLAALGASVHQLVPEAMLARGLARYFHEFRLQRTRREDCLRIIKQNYCRVLDRYQASFDRVEDHCFATATNTLASASRLL